MEAVVNGIRMHWRERSRGDPVLFVHGFPFSGRLWDEQLERLPQRWHLIAPDLRGFGRSELGAAAAADALTMDLLADDLAALLTHRGIGRAVVCGMSMGGYVALALWRRHGDRVRALVLCDTRAGADTAEQRAARLALAERVEREGPAAAAAAMLPKLVSERTRRERTDVVERLREMIEATRPATFVQAQRGMAERPDATDLLPTIDVPALVLVGSDDAITPPAEAELLARGIPDARLRVVQGAGHAACLEDPVAFNRDLVFFLEAVQGH